MDTVDELTPILSYTDDKVKQQHFRWLFETGIGQTVNLYTCGRADADVEAAEERVRLAEAHDRLADAHLESIRAHLATAKAHIATKEKLDELGEQHDALVDKNFDLQVKVK